MDIVIQGDFVDIKNVKTRSVVQMIIEIPIEQGEDLVRKFGYPNNQTSCPVAVAKITPKLVSDSSKDVHQSDLGQGGGKPKSFAGHGKLLIQDPLFGEYLSTEQGNICRSMIGKVTTERVMKKICLIESCSELIEGSDALEKLINLRSEFNAWKRARHQEQALSR